jgi:hypothetical protein
MMLTLMTGNAVYLHLSVSFIQMLKALTPAITMICLYLASVEVRSNTVRNNDGTFFQESKAVFVKRDSIRL